MPSELAKQLDKQERERAEHMAAVQDREPVGRQFHQQFALHTHQHTAAGEIEQHIYTEPTATESLCDAIGRDLQLKAEGRGESPLYYSVIPVEKMPV